MNINSDKGKKEENWDHLDDFSDWSDWDDDEKEDNLIANIKHLEDIMKEIEKPKDQKEKEMKNEVKNFRRATTGDSNNILNEGGLKQLEK